MNRFLMALSAAALLIGPQVASAQRPGGPGFGGGFGGAGAILSMPEVQKELNLSDEQKTKLREIMSENRPEGGRGNPGNLTDEERQKRFAEAQERMKKVEEKVSTILDEKQKDRLEQLRIQREGVAALARAQVAEKLGLAAEQKEKILKLQQEAGRGGAGGGGQNPRNLSDEERQKLIAEGRERREKLTNEVMSILTAEQKEKLEKLKGTKFDFPAPNFGNRQRNNNNN